MRKEYLIIVLSGLLFVSCLTDRQLLRNYDRFMAIAGKVGTTTTMRDTTIAIDQQVVIPIAPDSVNLVGEVRVVGGVPEMAPVEVKSRWIRSTVAVTNGKLEMKSKIIKTELPARLKAIVTLKGTIRETSKTTTLEKKVIPKFYRVSFWIVISVISLIAIWIASKLNLFTVFKKLLKIN